ncbi:LOW QUALITY PROTEIN: hypothetical protein PHMEG_00013434 [Phytophthora megakarya]|uniref:Uncharacterized protein n=1 Tax=Phytophthora megakarya TaxID=4795 RepID=A0A225W6A0_9STRA|nr:LOW QUALITY PROTEIN: hypothetical protein PHMEG_00013434 [Phytophthora megakarya]
MPSGLCVLALLFNVESATIRGLPSPSACLSSHRFSVLETLFRVPRYLSVVGLGLTISCNPVTLSVPWGSEGSFECGGNSVGIANEKADISLALWERRHWLQPFAMENCILAFRRLVTPRTRTSSSFSTFGPSSTELEISGPIGSIARLWDGCTGDDGPPEHPTEILLEPRHLQYSIEVLNWEPRTLDWSRELRVFDAKQPRRNCWVEAPADHPYYTLFAPCNSEIPLFVPTAWTHKAIASQVVVDPSLSEAEIQAPWVQDDSIMTEADP